jgi:hypothetical protein
MLRLPKAHTDCRVRAAVRSVHFPGLRHRACSTMPLLILALCACGMQGVQGVQVEPKISRSVPPLHTSGYVGGVFAKDTNVGFGFRLQNEQSTQSYVLEIDDEAISLIAVLPGRYHVESWLAWTFDPAKVTEQAIEEADPLRRSFDVQAGQVILLGEWRADHHRDPLRNTNTFTLLSVRITEPGSIRMLQEAYPRFIDVPVQCLHCIP